jgi:hypothetical protein
MHPSLVRRTALAVSALALAAVAAVAHADPDPSQVYIESFNHQGDGCPAGTTALNLSPDRQAMTVIFNSYYVEGGTQSSLHREEVLTVCLMNIAMHVPPAWQFTVQQVVYRGYASVDANTWGRQASTYRWAQMSDFQPLAFMRFIGPFDGDYTNVAQATMVWSGCRPRVPSTQNLILRSHIGVKGVRGFMTIDSLDHAITQQYRVAWRRCG